MFRKRRPYRPTTLTPFKLPIVIGRQRLMAPEALPDRTFRQM